MLHTLLFTTRLGGLLFVGGLLAAPLRAQTPADIDRLRNKAETLYNEGRYDQALTAYLDGYRMARRLDPVRAANLTVDISSIYHMRGNYRRGAAICQEGATLLTRAAAQPDSVWFKLNSSLGEMYKKLNSQDSCYLYFSRANALLRQHPDLESRLPEYVIFHYNNQGMMYVRAGGYTEGLSYLTKALAVAENQTTSKEDIAILQNNLGELYEGLGLFNKAKLLRKSALRNYTRNDLYKCKILNGIAEDALRNSLYPETTLYAKQALALSKAVMRTNSLQANLRSLRLALNCLGECAYSTGKLAEANVYFNIALQYSKRFGGNRGDCVSDTYIGLAHTLQKQGNLDSALVYCQQAIIASHSSFASTSLIANPVPGHALAEQSLFEALVLKADLFRQRFGTTKQPADLHHAQSAYACALTVADVLRKSYNALDTKWFFATQVRPAYLHAFETAFLCYKQTQKADDQAQAFSLLERSKAATLTDVTRELLIKPANVPAALLTQERELQHTITTQKLEATANPSPTLVDAQIQLAQLQQRLEKEFPAYYRAKYQPQPVSIAGVQTALDARTAYLSYLLTSDAVYIAVVTHDGLSLIRKSGNRPRLTVALTALDTALYTNPGLGNYTGTSAAITTYRWLIEPVAHLLKDTDRLVISRDGDLHRLPFEVLETGHVVDDFLVRQYAISYVASAGSLLQRAGSPAAPPKPTALGLAPFTEPTGTQTPPLLLPYLPASQAEVERLQGNVLLERAATKSRFMRSYPSYDILHFATHAYANNTEPARSYIAFYPDGNPDKLYAGEIYDLALPHTRLVVLSACQTGSGKLQPGEGIMSLAQAFAYAGCPSVVSSLWVADDESAAYLSRRLYEHLQAGLPIDVALQRARLNYLGSALYPKLSHPHYWANLTLVGDNRPVYQAPWPVVSMVSAALVLLLGLGGVLMLRQRRQTRRGGMR